MRSILLSTSAFFTFWPLISAAMARSCLPTAVASTMTSSASMPLSASCTALTMYSPRRLCGVCRPGVSRNTIWLCSSVHTPMMRLRVVWGRLDTMAIFSPIMAFISVLLPTLGRPTMATNPE